MIYERSGFGQRRGITDPGEEAPERRRIGEPVPPEEPTRYLPTAERIAALVSKHMESGYRLTTDEAVRMANGEIRPDQRFYLVEYQQAAKKLETAYRRRATEAAWLITLRNNMGYRLVEMQTCRYGYVIDPTTRRCVVETRPRPTPDDRVLPDDDRLLPDGEGIPEHMKKAAFEMPTWAWGVGAGVAVLLLVSMGGKR